MVEPDIALKPQFLGLAGEFRHRDAVSGDIVQPPQIARAGVISSVASMSFWSKLSRGRKHDAVFAKRDWPPIAVQR